jgi:hypothetical protein
MGCAYLLNNIGIYYVEAMLYIWSIVISAGMDYVYCKLGTKCTTINNKIWDTFVECLLKNGSINF